MSGLMLVQGPVDVKRIARIIISRTVVMYLAAYVLTTGFVDYERIWYHGGGQMLSRVRPHFNELVDFVDTKGGYSPPVLKQYQDYY